MIALTPLYLAKRYGLSQNRSLAPSSIRLTSLTSVAIAVFEIDREAKSLKPFEIIEAIGAA